MNSQTRQEQNEHNVLQYIVKCRITHYFAVKYPVGFVKCPIGNGPGGDRIFPLVFSTKSQLLHSNFSHFSFQMCKISTIRISIQVTAMKQLNHSAGNTSIRWSTQKNIKLLFFIFSLGYILQEILCADKTTPSKEKIEAIFLSECSFDLWKWNFVNKA